MKTAPNISKPMQLFLVSFLVSVALLLPKPSYAEVVETLQALLLENYLSRETAQTLVKALDDPRFMELEEKAIDNSGKVLFIEELTKELQKISGDKHLRVMLNKPDFQADASEIASLFSFKALDEDVAYLEARSFPIPTPEIQLFIANLLSQARASKALVIDLRENEGGNGAMFRFLHSFFFEASRFLIFTTYTRFNDTESELYSQLDLPGERLPEIPLFILTSKKTFSAAEALAYSLQAFKRATVVGEMTRGGGNMNSFFSLPSGYYASISTTSVTHAATKTNWEGVGIIPDVQVASGEALEKVLEIIGLE